MRLRTPSIVWLPFVFSVGTVSWALLLASLGLLSGLLIAPALAELREAEVRRNDVQATVALLDEQIALQAEFLLKARTDPAVIQRLASRQLNVDRPDQEYLHLDPQALFRDRSTENLLASSLPTITPEPVEPLPWFLLPALHKPTRPLLLTAACAGMLVSFLLGVRYEHPAMGR